MAESSQDHSTPDFGTNQWLVEEMYERFQEDPSSVDASWVTFFKNGAPTATTNGTAPVNGTAAPTTSAAPPAAEVATAPAQAQLAAPAHVEASAPAGPARDVPTTPTAKAAPVETPSVGTALPTATKAEAPGPAVQPASTGPGEVDKKILRGAAARTVQNMDASLAVPTATSVRAMPVKLLFDNRTVINNHLARARGGKVSFTHLIGWAIVQAIKAMPEMNTGFEIVDGKPNQLQPEHINFGLAIDLQKPDGSRSLLGPSIKAAETTGFAEFGAAELDRIRGRKSDYIREPFPDAPEEVIHRDRFVLS